MNKTLVAAAVAAVLLPLTASCGSSEDVADDPTTSTTPSDTPTTEPTTAPATTPTSPPTSSTPTDDGSRLTGMGFSFAIPEEWEDITASLEEDNPQLDVAIGEKDADTFRTNFNVVTASATTATIEDDSDALRQEAAKELKTVTKADVTSLPDRTIDGEAAIGQASTLDASGNSVSFVQYVAIHEGKAYPVTMTFATSNAADAKATLAGILDSWQWT